MMRLLLRIFLVDKANTSMHYKLRLLVVFLTVIQKEISAIFSNIETVIMLVSILTFRISCTLISSIFVALY